MIPVLPWICDSGRMRDGVEVRLRRDERERLEGVVADRKSPQHHVWRARIVLIGADDAGTMAIRAATGKSKPTIWRAGFVDIISA